MRDINYLRESLMSAMDKLADGTMSVDNAKAMADLAQVVVNSAKIEVDLIKNTHTRGTGFMRDYNRKLLGEEGE